MGSVRLKKKTELNYRKGSTNEAENCKHCENFVPEFVFMSCTVFNGAKCEVRRFESRCRIMGLKSSAKYRVRADHRCIAHTTSKEYEQKIAEMWKGFTS